MILFLRPTKKRFLGWFNEDCPEANRLISFMILADYFDLPKPARVNFDDNILNAWAVTNTRQKYVRISKDAVSASYVYYHEILHLVFPSHTYQIKNIFDNLYSPVYGVTPDQYNDAVKEVEKAMLETLSKDINLYKRSIYKPSRHRYYYR